jgi:hypothetical protein
MTDRLFHRTIQIPCGIAGLIGADQYIQAADSRRDAIGIEDVDGFPG